MPSILKRTATAVAACTVILVAASSASAKTLNGTVVHKNARAHAFVVASRGGRLAAIHAHRLPSVGRVVTVSARRLRNGTFVARHIRIRSHSRRRHARIRGSVTFVRPRHRSFVVSVRGASILVHGARARRMATASAAGSLPPVGSVVEINATLDDQGNLESNEVHQVGEVTSGIELEGVVLAVDPLKRTLMISADDDNETGQSVLVNVPEELDITAFHVGQEVSLTVTSSAEGFVLQNSSCDGSAREANDQNSEQGDKSGSGEGSGDSGESKGGSGD